MVRERVPVEKPEPVRRQEPPELGDTPCDLCRTLWPAEALEKGACPDCLDEDGPDRI